MKRLWNWVEEKELPAQQKYTLYRRLLTILWAFCGLLLWLGLYITLGAGLKALVILVGYPVVFSWIPVFFYTCRHPFGAMTQAQGE